MKAMPAEVIDEPKELAQVAVEDSNEGNEVLARVIPVLKVFIEQTTEWQAADMLQRFAPALRTIARVDANPHQIAEDALRME
jgi:hypothetical protein